MCQRKAINLCTNKVFKLIKYFLDITIVNKKYIGHKYSMPQALWNHLHIWRLDVKLHQGKTGGYILFAHE